MKPGHCKAELGLPTAISHLSSAFSNKLVSAYRDSYAKNVIFVSIGGLKYWKKFVFVAAANNPARRRTVLHRGDYVAYCRGPNKVYARLDHIFTHEASRGWSSPSLGPDTPEPFSPLLNVRSAACFQTY